MKTNYTHLAILLDRSGSMSGIKDYVIEGFNKLIKDQQKEAGELTVSLVQFDDEYETLLDFVPVADVKNLDDKMYIPRGMTALNDSSARMIKELGNKFATMTEDERPERVLFVTISDGLENASVDFDRMKGGNQRLKEIVKHQEEKYNWKFLYIGANQDSQKEGSTLRGFSKTMNFTASKVGVDSMYDDFGKTVALYRSTGKLDEDVKPNVTNQQDTNNASL